MDIVTDRDYMHVRCREADENDPLVETAKSLFAVLKERKAYGLSANQIQVRLRIFVMRMDPYTPVCIVNPVIVKKKGSDTREEMCLSANATVSIERPKEVVVKGVNEYFKPVRYKLTGLMAHVVCHEVDHLDGKLITDGLEEVKSELQERMERLNKSMGR